MRAIILGADGNVGSALLQALVARGDVAYGTTRRSPVVKDELVVDFAAPDIEAARLPEADIAFFCAAMTGFRECRSNPALARQVNVTGPVSLARRLVASGTTVVLLSTNAVFDWSIPRVSATAPRSPVTVYGELKAEAEREFETLGAKASIIRFTKILAPNFGLIGGWIEALSRGEPVTAFADLHTAPVSLDDAVAALLAVADNRAGGIYQVSATDDVSYYQCASYIASRLAADPALVNAGSAREAGIPPEEIIRFSSLDASRVAGITGRPVPDPYAVIDAVYGRRFAAARTAIKAR
jgi:dTDP-4-dehydrorhamnose reductase